MQKLYADEKESENSVLTAQLDNIFTLCLTGIYAVLSKEYLAPILILFIYVLL